ncbi:glycosyltransferase family 4 protein [Thalassotalea fonticola]|uniref:Glycosyltransferase family 4 protein n=1 Tax=Thalassotalea fonticola TaxID=3065649 RepID=A0ABZ0GT32_9GAMM|nr:glycosyltransferase family 4 protein [Colwelliaceae bacterium S1-1]
MKIIIIGGLPDSLINFRGDLIKEWVRNGHEVIAMAAFADSNLKLNVESLGCRFKSFPIERNGLNPFSDLKVLISLYKTFKLEKPDKIIAYTIKPVIWGGIAARFYSDSQFYGLITGLGFAFQRGGFKRNLLGNIATGLYKLALSKASSVIFQNPDNQQVFIDQKIVPADRTKRVYGSGVNLSRYENIPLPVGRPVFLTIARLLGEKGLREFAKAAMKVKFKYPEARFQIVGPEDPSPDGIPISEVMKWHNSDAVEYLGGTNDVRPFINNCHIFVLASYHEGMPRTVLEAMSIGRPILTTNVEGCRETVTDGFNGFLVPKQDVNSLANRMVWFIENQNEWSDMANQSRKMAEDKFDVKKVNESLLEIMQLKRSDNA